MPYKWIKKRGHYGYWRHVGWYTDDELHEIWSRGDGVPKTFTRPGPAAPLPQAPQQDPPAARSSPRPKPRTAR
jgi:hypothetical protein